MFGENQSVQGMHEHMCSYVELDPMEQNLPIALALPSNHVFLQCYFLPINCCSKLSVADLSRKCFCVSLR
jgi:hypothetical protein